MPCQETEDQDSEVRSSDDCFQPLKIKTLKTEGTKFLKTEVLKNGSGIPITRVRRSKAETNVESNQASQKLKLV